MSQLERDGIPILCTVRELTEVREAALAAEIEYGEARNAFAKAESDLRVAESELFRERNRLAYFEGLWVREREQRLEAGADFLGRVRSLAPTEEVA
jgi:hypothetical protein